MRGQGWCGGRRGRSAVGLGAVSAGCSPLGWEQSVQECPQRTFQIRDAFPPAPLPAGEVWVSLRLEGGSRGGRAATAGTAGVGPGGQGAWGVVAGQGPE